MKKLTLLSLAALAALPGIHSLRCEASLTVEALQDKLINLNTAASNIVNRGDAEGRDLTADEQTELDAIYAQFEDTKANIARRERVASMGESISASAGRRVAPEVVDDGEPVATGAAAARAAAATPGPARHAVRNSMPAQLPSVEERGKGGFLSMGDFLVNVVRGSQKGATPDPRLKNAAPGSYGSEGVGVDGGFAVPPDFKTTILAKVMGVDALLPLTDNQTTSSNGMSFPVDETTPWGSAGIQAYWTAEGGLKTPSKPALGLKAVKLNKLACLVPCTDELLEDATALAGYIGRRAPEVMTYKVNEAIIRGSGIGTPLGILPSAGTVVVAAEAGQAAGTVLFQNILKLWAAIRPEGRSAARWFMHPDVESQIMAMQFPGTGTAVPVYLPPGGLSTSPYGTLLGKQIMPQDACSALGLKGDIIFGDLKNYLAVTKAGGVKQDVSMHIWFDYDITAFRFVLRVGGEPWWNAGVAPAQSGATTRAYFATLAARP